MVQTSTRTVLEAVLEIGGPTFAEELGIPLERNTPAPLFRMLCFALLASAPIGHRIAVKAARALADAGWTTPRRMAASTWRQRTDTLNRAGYARYDESTSRELGDTTHLLLDRYGGDLRRLRETALRDPDAERRLLQEFKGIGEVGTDIFFREVQLVWDELFPFLDRRALEAARRLDLGTNENALRELVRDRHEYVRLMAALVRIELEDRYDEVRDAAAES